MMAVCAQWNGFSASKGCEFVYVGSSFAVVAGNLTRKNPGESEFLMSDTFSLLLN